MDKVQKHNSFNTNTPSSESYKNHRSIPQVFRRRGYGSRTRIGLILWVNFYLSFLPAGGQPLCSLSGDRLDKMKTTDLKTLETLEKLY
jgi:hypothetical protein